MNQQQIDSFMADPALLDHYSLNQLGEIIKIYPYYATAHLLYLRNLKNLQHHTFYSQLRLASVYAGNRHILKHFLDETRTIPASHTHQTEKRSGKEGIIATDKRHKPITSSSSIEDQQKRQAIIDRFVSQAPVMNKPDKDFFNPADYARQSNVDNESIVSETLAIILLRQGHLKKAMNIYEKLSLDFPEKSRYFAAQIQKIKDQGKKQE